MQQLRERIEALEAGSAKKPAAASDAVLVDKDKDASESKVVPKLSLGGGGGSTPAASKVPGLAMPSQESKIASPKTRPASAAATRVRACGSLSCFLKHVYSCSYDPSNIADLSCALRPRPKTRTRRERRRRKNPIA